MVARRYPGRHTWHRTPIRLGTTIELPAPGARAAAGTDSSGAAGVGQFTRSVSVPGGVSHATRHLLLNLAALIGQLPGVTGVRGVADAPNQVFLVHVKARGGEEGRLETRFHLQAGPEGSTPFETAKAHFHDLPDFVPGVRGSYLVRPDGDVARIDVVLEVDGVGDDDPAVIALIDQGARFLAERLRPKHKHWL